ncbi:MAG: hypothetical protein MUO31_10300 [Thermodesulfovibrionales bacterium]|nr:hypothetical protein [Thermodesulfovibrionales bacterium]
MKDLATFPFLEERKEDIRNCDPQHCKRELRGLLGAEILFAQGDHRHGGTTVEKGIS